MACPGGADGVELVLEDGSRHRFDHVVIASHADQALAMLAEPTDDERELLGAWLEENPGTRVRLLGVGGSRLSPAGQPDLFRP